MEHGKCILYTENNSTSDEEVIETEVIFEDMFEDEHETTGNFV